MAVSQNMSGGLESQPIHLYKDPLYIGLKITPAAEREGDVNVVISLAEEAGGRSYRRTSSL